MVLEKFHGNSLTEVTTVGESGEISYFCYTISFLNHVFTLKHTFTWETNKTKQKHFHTLVV